jgi:Polyketide cyclase / dehydrase and lipid transport
MAQRLPCLLLAALACAAPAAAGSGVPEGLSAAAGAQVSFSELPAEDLYSVHGTFETPATPAEAWRVLSDYQGLAGMVSGLESSRVVGREGGRLLVEQVMEGHFLFFGRTLRLRLWITERPPLLIEFSNADPTPFRRYQGAWRISPMPAGCGVDYTLKVSRGDLAPRFLEPGLFKENSEGLLRDLSRELTRRAADVGVEKPILPQGEPRGQAHP